MAQKYVNCYWQLCKLTSLGSFFSGLVSLRTSLLHTCNKMYPPVYRSKVLHKDMPSQGYDYTDAIFSIA